MATVLGHENGVAFFLLSHIFLKRRFHKLEPILQEDAVLLKLKGRGRE